MAPARRRPARWRHIDAFPYLQTRQHGYLASPDVVTQPDQSQLGLVSDVAEICRGRGTAGYRGIGVGYPERVNLAFDSEEMALRLPGVGGAAVQTEDEIAAIASVVGASVAGVKAMTATSGPGFSLMQEALGYAVMAEIRKAESRRGEVVAAVAREWNVPPEQVGLAFLVEHAPDTLRATFEDHRIVFQELVGEIEVLTKENRRLATVALDGIQGTLGFAGGHIYDAAGRATEPRINR